MFESKLGQAEKDVPSVDGECDSAAVNATASISIRLAHARDETCSRHMESKPHNSRAKADKMTDSEQTLQAGTDDG